MTVTFSHLGAYGRRGNAMFQIAATIGYAKKHNVPFYFPEWIHQKEFTLSDSFYVTRSLLKFSVEIFEQTYWYSEIPFKPDCSLFGYFQSWKYFEHCQDYIRDIFRPREQVDQLRGICGIHVRRGDYLEFPNHHPALDMNYYNQAIERIPVSKFLVFSNDVDWCRKNFIGDRFIVTDPASSAIDFRMLSACNHFIVGNSSFSWWAAWLGTFPDKIVIAPKTWFGPAISSTHPTHDLIPPDWVIV